MIFVQVVCFLAATILLYRPVMFIVSTFATLYGSKRQPSETIDVSRMFIGQRFPSLIPPETPIQIALRESDDRAVRRNPQVNAA